MEDHALSPQLVVSEDGSHTLRLDALREHYHSHKGALTESRHVYIANGLRAFPDHRALKVLEVGFGTGLNALLTVLEKRSAAVHYTTLEPYPLPEAVVSQLNHSQVIDAPGAREAFEQLHAAAWNKSTAIAPEFQLTKLLMMLQDFHSSEAFDLVYYDAFAPHAQPELWTMEMWLHLHVMMSDNGLLVTYCAKGQVRRDLQSAGFRVERLVGPPGKREMLRAWKQ